MKSEKAKREQQRRDDRIAAGLCRLCGLRPPEPKSKDCAECRQTASANNKRRYERLTSSGLCPCGHNPPAPDRKTCQPCIDARVQHKREARRQAKLFVIEHFGGRCVECGETDIRALSLDHVNRDGAEHRRQLRGAKSIYTHIAKELRSGEPFRWKLQILCFNCHAKKDLRMWWM